MFTIIFMVGSIPATFLKALYDILTFKKDEPGLFSGFPPALIYFCKYSFIIMILIVLSPLIRYNGTSIIKYLLNFPDYIPDYLLN